MSAAGPMIDPAHQRVQDLLHDLRGAAAGRAVQPAVTREPELDPGVHITVQYSTVQYSTA